MQCHQRRRASSVDRDGRPLEAERVGDASRSDAARAALALVALELTTVQNGRVVVVHDTGEDTGRTAAQRCRVDAGPLQRFPGGLEQQALLGVRGQGLTW